MLLVHVGLQSPAMPALTAWTFGQPSSPALEPHGLGAGLSLFGFAQKVSLQFIGALHIVRHAPGAPARSSYNVIHQAQSLKIDCY